LQYVKEINSSLIKEKHQSRRERRNMARGPTSKGETKHKNKREEKDTHSQPKT
jgi:hypothetical protein